WWKEFSAGKNPASTRDRPSLTFQYGLYAFRCSATIIKLWHSRPCLIVPRGTMWKTVRMLKRRRVGIQPRIGGAALAKRSRAVWARGWLDEHQKHPSSLIPDSRS